MPRHRSLASRAVRGALWTIGSSIGARGIGVIGTLVLTHLLVPEVIGEVMVASVLALTASQLSVIGFGQYVIAKPNCGREVVFHASFYHLLFGVVAIGAVVLVGPWLEPVFSSPHLMDYLPGLALAVAITRIGFMPERILARDMRFAVIGVTRTASEVGYTVVSVGLAAIGFGGDAIVIANVVQALIRTTVFVMAVDRREWLQPTRIRRDASRDIFRFGVPLAIGVSANFASRKWDNLLYSSVFGPALMGIYNLAYNLADIPASQVGEHIGDVLLPSYAKMKAEQRRQALVRSSAILALIVFPLAIGLGAVAEPLVEVLFNDEWQGVAPMLVILAGLSVVRPVGWTVASYLQAIDRTRSIMVLEVGKVLVLLGAVWALGQLGPLWACGAAGVAFGLHAVGSIWAVARVEPISMSRLAAGMVGPLVACVPMVAAVLGVRYGLRAVDLYQPLLSLALEIAAGAAVYVAAAFVFAPRTARDCLGLIKRALGKG